MPVGGKARGRSPSRNRPEEPQVEYAYFTTSILLESSAERWRDNSAFRSELKSDLAEKIGCDVSICGNARDSTFSLDVVTQCPVDEAAGLATRIKMLRSDVTRGGVVMGGVACASLGLSVRSEVAPAVDTSDEKSTCAVDWKPSASDFAQIREELAAAAELKADPRKAASVSELARQRRDESTIARLEAQLAAEQERSEGLARELAEAASDLQQQKEQMLESRISLEKELAALHDEISKAEDATGHASMRHELERLKGELERSKGENALSQSKLSSMQQSSAASENEAERLKVQIKLLENHVNELQEKLQKQSSNTATREDLEAAQLRLFQRYS